MSPSTFDNETSSFPSSSLLPVHDAANAAGLNTQLQTTGSLRTNHYAFLAGAQAEDELGWLAHYRVRKLIGEGAIGLVFLAEDTHLRRPVALKVIKPEFSGSPEILSRFVREAQATAAIKHDHIVTIYQVGQDRDVHFLAMEYLHGLSLQQWLDLGRKVPEPLVLRIGREIASGLAAAHGIGLIHRDIKPANLWIESPSGRIKILDFGMARSDRDQVQITQAGRIMGTPAYMSPEQAHGEIADARSDLFSLGCVLYRLCAGRLPFDGPSVMAVLTALTTATPRPLREFDPEIDPDFEDLVSQLLAKNPSDRPASAQVVIDSIKSIERKRLGRRKHAHLVREAGPRAEQESIEAGDETVGAVEALPPVVVAHRRSRVIAVVLAVIMIGVILVGTRGGREEQELAVRPLVAGSATAIRLKTGDIASRAPDGGSGFVGLAAGRPSGSTVHDAGPAVHDDAVAIDGPRPPAVVSDAGARVVELPEVPDRRIALRTAEIAPRPTVEPPKVVVAPVTPSTVENEWNYPIDPDLDCKIDIDNAHNQIKIAIPGTAHVLSAEINRLNAPRVLKPVQGDFDVVVNVAGVSHPSGRATMAEYPPYHGAGILLWQDDRNYIRVEIATDVIAKGKLRPYANFEIRKDGKLTVSKGLAFKDGSSWVRLERKGNDFRASFGPDATHWTSFVPVMVPFDESLNVGVTAINSASKALTAELGMFAIRERTAGTEASR